MRGMNAWVPLLLVAAVAGCANLSGSRLASLQSRELRSRVMGQRLNATYDQVWWGTVTALQNAGFVLRTADKDAGFIYGVWSDVFETKGEIPFLLFSIPIGYREVEVSVTLERRGEHSTVLRVSNRLGSAGESQDDALFPQRFFAAVQKEVFRRQAAKRLGGVLMPKAT